MRAEIDAGKAAVAGGCSDREIDDARAILSVSLASNRSISPDEVRAEGLAWRIALQDDAPDENVSAPVLRAAVTEFLRGSHGKFFPPIAEFVVVCKHIRSVAFGEIRRRERYCELPVEAKPQINEAMRERVAELLAGFDMRRKGAPDE